MAGCVLFANFFRAKSLAFGSFSLITRSSVVVVGFFRSGSVQPRPWWCLLLSAWPARAWVLFFCFLRVRVHCLSCAVVAGVDRWFRLLSAAGGLLMMACVLHALAPKTSFSDAAVFVVFW